jgi:hypothetical protein
MPRRGLAVLVSPDRETAAIVGLRSACRPEFHSILAARSDDVTRSRGRGWEPRISRKKAVGEPMMLLVSGERQSLNPQIGGELQP